MLPATLSLFLAALPTGQTPDFAREVRPLLAEHCVAGDTHTKAGI